MKSIFLIKKQSGKCEMKFMDWGYKDIKTMFDSQIEYPLLNVGDQSRICKNRKLRMKMRIKLMK